MNRYTAVIALAFTVLMVVFDFLIEGTVSGRIVVSGVLSGLLFALALSIYTRLIRNRVSKIVVPLDNEEHLLKEGAANAYLDNKRGIGGKLALTDRRIIFIPSNPKAQSAMCSISRREIDSVQARKPFGGIMLNVFEIKLNDERVKKFIVDVPEDWIKVVSQN